MVQWKATDTCEYKIQSGNYSGYSKCRQFLILHNNLLSPQTLCSKKRRMHAGINYRHYDADFIDFDIQHLLPHKLSEYTPALASGDLDGNGFDDHCYRWQLIIFQPVFYFSNQMGNLSGGIC